MTLFPHVADRWRSVPAFIVGAVGVLLLIGLVIIFQNEAAYREQERQEVGVQAEILAASVAAALDFDDPIAAQDAVNAFRVNRQMQIVAVYDDDGRMVAGHSRGDRPIPAAPPRPGDSAIAAVAPVLNGDARLGSVYLSADAEAISTRAGRYLIVGLLVLMAALVIIVLGGGHAALRRSNQELHVKARQLSEANEALQVEMFEREKAEEQLRQAQKMQALGQLTGGIAHDFNNMLTVIQGSADMLARHALPDSKRQRFAEAIVQTSGRAAALTSQLLAFARRQPLRPEVIDINALVSGLSDLLNRTLGDAISISIDLAAQGCNVEADRAQLESAILNLCVNARDAMPGGGAIRISTAVAADDGGARQILVRIADEGEGMSAATLERVFEPFFTTKELGKGTGLGLSQVYGFAQQSGGDVEIESELGVGTCVTLSLPCSQEAPRREQAAPVARHDGPARAILLVEDNVEVGEFAETLLIELGHRVVRVASGAEALDALDAGRFDLVFSDVVMPGMTGLELAETVAARHPDVAVVLATGYSDDISASGSSFPVLLKPYKIDELRRMIAEIGR